MIIIYLLAVVGALCLLSTAAMIVGVIIPEKIFERKIARKTAAVDKGTCKGCPKTEEAENDTSSFNRH